MIRSANIPALRSELHASPQSFDRCLANRPLLAEVQDSSIEDQLWSGWKDQWRDLFGYPGVQEVWTIRRHHFSEEFREFVGLELAGKESKPLYAVDEAAHV